MRVKALDRTPRIRHPWCMRSAWLLPFLLLAVAPVADAQSGGWRTQNQRPGWTQRARVGGSSRVQRGGVPSSRAQPRRSYSANHRQSRRAPSRRVQSRPSDRFRTRPSKRNRHHNRHHNRNRQRGQRGVTVNIGPGVTFTRPSRRSRRSSIFQPPRVAVRTRIQGGSLSYGNRSHHSRRVVQNRHQTGTSFEYRGAGVRYTQRWTAPPRVASPHVVYVDRPVVERAPVDQGRYERRELTSPPPLASGAPVIVRRRSERRPATQEATPTRAEAPPERGAWRTARPRQSLNAPRATLSTRPGVADRLLAKLEAADLSAACEVAAWAKDNPRREQILRTALFARFPSPTLLRESARRLRDDPASRNHPGRPTLARLLD